MLSSLSGMTLGNLGGFGSITPTNPWGDCPIGYKKSGTTFLGTTLCDPDISSCPPGQVPNPGPGGGCIDASGGAFCPPGHAYDPSIPACYKIDVPTECEKQGGYIDSSGQCVPKGGGGTTGGSGSGSGGVQKGGGGTAPPVVTAPPEETPWGTYALVAAAAAGAWWIYSRRKARQEY